MPRKLTVVAEGQSAPRKPTAESQSIAAATEDSERALLVSLRRHLAAEMDKGAVPAHALASVSAKIREYDREIRALDARDKQEAEKRDGVATDQAFDASAI